MNKNGVRTLLMGGQACVLYGAAEFSRDLDLLVLIDPENLDRLRFALADLRAEPVAVPSLDASYLSRGHAVHFRCRRDDVDGLRVDLMSVLRKATTFEEMWRRRTTIAVEGETVDVMAIEDLLNAKKTQRDKDWPMLQRLIEQSYFTGKTEGGSANPELVRFWFRELRTAELLVESAGAWPDIARELAGVRPAVAAAMAGDLSLTTHALEAEEGGASPRSRVLEASESGTRTIASPAA